MTKKETEHAVRMFSSGFSIASVTKTLQENGVTGVSGRIMRHEIEAEIRQALRLSRAPKVQTP